MAAIGQCLCGNSKWRLLFHYDKPPAGETHFDFVDQPYQRDIFQCQNCGHCRASHNLPLDTLYTQAYMAATYGSKMRSAYGKIMALPPEQSDNAGRVTRICSLLGPGQGRQVLDIGSGLCVFLARMKDEGWEGTALDPDERAVAHARDIVGVRGICASWPTDNVERNYYDLVTFNKVLEHVEDPENLLAKAKTVVKLGGLVYIEVPDGEAATADGPGREEFFIEHWQVFSPLSLIFLIRRSGFAVRLLERLREPSGKYTLRAVSARL